MPKAYVGKFNIPAPGVTGNQTITGIVDKSGNPFTPKCIIIWGQTDTKNATNTSEEEWNSFGFSDGTNNWGSVINSRWFVSQPWRGVQTSRSYCIQQQVSVFTSASHLAGAVISFGNGTFTYRLDVNLDGGGTYFNWFNFIAIGGDDVSAKVGFTTFSGTGSHALTGIGFQPTGGFFCNDYNGAFNDSIGEMLNVGWCDTALNQFAMCSGLAEGFNPSVGSGSLRSGYISITNNDNAGTIQLNQILTSWDSDGFTINYLNAGHLGYLVLGGPTTYAGTFNELTSDGSQTVTPVGGLIPTAIIFGSVGQVTSTSIQHNENFSVGAYDGTNQRAFWNGSIYGSDGSGGGGQNWGADKSLVLALGNGGPSTSLIEKGILTGTSLDVSGFHGDWTSTDGVARQVIYFTFGTLFVPNVGSGLYKLVPDKHHDTIYTAFDPTQTEDLPIPAFADTYPAGGDS